MSNRSDTWGIFYPQQMSVSIYLVFVSRNFVVLVLKLNLGGSIFINLNWFNYKGSSDTKMCPPPLIIACQGKSDLGRDQCLSDAHQDNWSEPETLSVRLHDHTDSRRANKLSHLSNVGKSAGKCIAISVPIVFDHPETETFHRPTDWSTTWLKSVPDWWMTDNSTDRQSLLYNHH